MSWDRSGQTRDTVRPVGWPGLRRKLVPEKVYNTVSLPFPAFAGSGTNYTNPAWPNGVVYGPQIWRDPANHGTPYPFDRRHTCAIACGFEVFSFTTNFDQSVAPNPPVAGIGLGGVFILLLMYDTSGTLIVDPISGLPVSIILAHTQQGPTVGRVDAVVWTPPKTLIASFRLAAQCFGQSSFNVSFSPIIIGYHI